MVALGAIRGYRQGKSSLTDESVHVHVFRKFGAKYLQETGIRLFISLVAPCVKQKELLVRL